MSREGDALKMIGKADGHSPAMGLKTYALAGPKEDIAVGEKVYRQVFGSTVEWPSANEVQWHQRTIDNTATAVGALMHDVDECEGSSDELMDKVELAS